MKEVALGSHESDTEAQFQSDSFVQILTSVVPTLLFGNFAHQE